MCTLSNRFLFWRCAFSPHCFLHYSAVWRYMSGCDMNFPGATTSWTDCNCSAGHWDMLMERKCCWIPPFFFRKAPFVLLAPCWLYDSSFSIAWCVFWCFLPRPKTLWWCWMVLDPSLINDPAEIGPAWRAIVQPSWSFFPIGFCNPPFGSIWGIYMVIWVICINMWYIYYIMKNCLYRV